MPGLLVGTTVDTLVTFSKGCGGLPLLHAQRLRPDQEIHKNTLPLLSSTIYYPLPSSTSTISTSTLQSTIYYPLLSKLSIRMTNLATQTACHHTLLASSSTCHNCPPPPLGEEAEPSLESAMYAKCMVSTRCTQWWGPKLLADGFPRT